MGRSSTRRPSRRQASDVARHRDRDPRAGRIRRLCGDLEDPEHAAHTADVGHQRDPRDRADGRAAADWLSERGIRAVPACGRDRLRDDQHHRRVLRDRPDARNVQAQGPAEGRGRGRGRGVTPPVAAVSSNITDGLYIVAFALLIYGMTGLTGPRTAVRGNLIAAAGMAIAFISTLLHPHVFHGSSTPWLIALGLVVGTAIGIPAARRVRMTAMPQMVALFNGVGGGAVFLITLAEFRNSVGYNDTATY